MTSTTGDRRGHRRWFCGFAVAASLYLAMANPVAAQEINDSSWEFFVTPYVWLPGMEVTTRPQGPIPGTETDVSIGDVVESLDMALQGTFEVRNGRYIGILDFNYFDLSSEQGLDGIVFNSAEVGISGILASANFGYRVVEPGPVSLDVFAGVQVVSMDVDLSLSGRMPVGTSKSETLVDPIVGGRVFLELGSGFFVGTAGTIGGFGVDSELTWQLIGQVGWQANDWLTLRAGYRHLEIELDSSHLIDNLTMSGPIIGATFRL